MDGDDDNDSAPAYVPVRPYSAQCAAAGERRKTAAKAFRPTPPNERRNVERVVLASTPAEATAQSLLQDAWRRQELEDASGARSRSFAVPDRFAGMSLKKFGLGAAGRSHTGLGSAGVPRKVKERREGRSREIMDLAFDSGSRIVNGEVKLSYAPISIPYFSIKEEEDEAAAPNSAEKKKGRPELVHVDEANANAAKELFLDAEGGLQEDQILLIQLPAILPELLDPREEFRGQDDASSSGPAVAIDRMPDGLLGKIRIHKSGKVRMDIGGVPFCVDQGCDTFFSTKIWLVCALWRMRSSTWVLLGSAWWLLLTWMPC